MGPQVKGIWFRGLRDWRIDSGLSVCRIGFSELL